MALSGIIWVGFLLGHMIGNLFMFIGPDSYNAYGHAITSGMFIYIVEAVLVGTLLVHVGLAIRLTIANRCARMGQSYSGTQNVGKTGSIASRTMAIHGLFILAFIILHLIGFKYGPYYETNVQGTNMRDLYRLVVEVFQQPIYVAWYVLCLVLLGFHLSHGIKSIFQSLGLLHPAYQKFIKTLSCLYAAIVAGGFIAQPLFVFLFVR